MHIITGFVIAMLAGRLKKNKDLGGMPILKTGPLRVAHAIPGRLRFSVPDLCGCRPSDLQPVQSLAKLPGVATVKASHISGSIIVTFAPQRIKPVMILMGLARILGVEHEIEKGATPKVMTKLKDIGEGLNRAVYEEAHGLIDLKTLLVMSLIVTGGIRIWRERGAAIPAGVTLLWWAFNSIKHESEIEG